MALMRYPHHVGAPCLDVRCKDEARNQGATTYRLLFCTRIKSQSTAARTPVLRYEDSMIRMRTSECHL